ncbi:hypothetical protein [Actinomadura sp. 9N407]|uniref:hypothetical protein n=1 Tax=Actinomadura sp. 9N407 TaxID=3375154 RepID=UPI0037AAD9A3
MIDIKYHPLAFIYRLWTPVVTLNGQRVPANWGPNALVLPPGHYQLGIHIPYLLPPEIGRAGASVPLQPGAQVHLEYRAPLATFMQGALGAAPQKWPGLILTYVISGSGLVLIPLIAVVFILAGASAE